MTERKTSALSGRRAEARRNDERILRSARAVFIADPHAPIAAVAKHAGVGISALYARYPSKDDLLRTLASDGLQQFVDTLERFLADDGDNWTVFCQFMRAAVDADTSSLTLALAGTFTPTPELNRQADRSAELFDCFIARSAEAGVLRPGLTVHDLSLCLQMIAAIRVADETRQHELRHRYLEMLLECMSSDHPPLRGRAPTWRELTEQWSPSPDAGRPASPSSPTTSGRDDSSA